MNKKIKRQAAFSFQMKYIGLIAIVISTLDQSSAASPRLPSLRELISSKIRMTRSVGRILVDYKDSSLVDHEKLQEREFTNKDSTSLPFIRRLSRAPRVSSPSMYTYTRDVPSYSAVIETNASLPVFLNDTSNGRLDAPSSRANTTEMQKRGLFLFRRKDRFKMTRNEPLDDSRNKTSIQVDNEIISQWIDHNCKYNQTDGESSIVSSNMTQPIESSSPPTTIDNMTLATGPSFIVVQRSPIPSRSAPLGYYKGGLVIPSSPASPIPLHSPSPTTESSLVLIISALQPILSKLFLYMLLSGSSLFFGPSDVHPIFSPSPTQHFMLEIINDRYSRDDIAFQRAVRFPPANKSRRMWNMLLGKRRQLLQRALESGSENSNHRLRNHRKNSALYAKTVLIIDVHTEDIHNAVEYLRDAVSFILHQYHSKDSRLDLGTDLEIVFKVESPGGGVQDYGLAANQIARLRESGKERGDLTVTVCVDKVAASGGYMIACQASPGQLLAAPMAIVGSIGVFRETLNFFDILTKYGIRPLLIKAGKAKASLTPMNEVTKEGIAFAQKNIDVTHEIFKKMVLDQRAGVIDEKHVSDVTSGDIFLGTNALGLGLVDRLVTSDEYIAEKVRHGDRVLRLQKYDKSRAGMRFSPLDFLLPYKDSFLQSNLSWIQRFPRVVSSILKLGLSASLIKTLDLV